MQELINKLTSEAGLSAEQASGAASTVLNFVKSKLPEGLADKAEAMLSGAEGEQVDLGGGGLLDSLGDMLGGAKDKAGDALSGVTGAAGGIGEKAEGLAEGVTDKIGDLAEGAGDAIEGLADKAGDALKDGLGKLGGMFGKKD